MPMRARDVMTQSVVTVAQETPVEDVARTLIDHRVSAVPVTGEDGRLVGIVSEGDLMRRPESETEASTPWWLALVSSRAELAADYVKTHGRTARDVMTRDVVTVEESATVEEIADILERRGIKRVPVLRDGELVGIVSRANLLHGLVTAKVARHGTADDETIRTAVLEAVREDARVDDQFINVTVSEGTVHLWGAVGSEAEKRAANLAAQNTWGVRAVDDHLGIVPLAVRSAS